MFHLHLITNPFQNKCAFKTDKSSRVPVGHKFLKTGNIISLGSHPTKLLAVLHDVTKKSIGCHDNAVAENFILSSDATNIQGLPVTFKNERKPTAVIVVTIGFDT